MIQSFKKNKYKKLPYITGCVTLASFREIENTYQENKSNNPGKASWRIEIKSGPRTHQGKKKSGSEMF